MKTLLYDLNAGISGDMNLGALISLGINPEKILSVFKKLDLPISGIDTEEVSRKGISGTRVSFRITGKQHHHTPFSEIKRRVRESKLHKPVKQKTLGIFQVLAEAESKVHNTPVERVHFHEAGAVDSIADIAGAAYCFTELGIESISATPITLGSGFVKCAHGNLPVPAPATAEILKNTPVSGISPPHEATTPTGAAIVSYMADSFVDSVNIQYHSIGYGAGSRDTDLPNILRVFMCDSKEERGIRDLDHDTVLVVESTIDDMNPELIPPVIEELIEKGAYEAYTSNVTGKNGRNSLKLTAIVHSNYFSSISYTILNSTTSLGIRYFKAEREKLKRVMKTVKTEYGEIRIKYSLRPDSRIDFKPEVRDCIALSRKHGIDTESVCTAAIRSAEKLKPDSIE